MSLLLGSKRGEKEGREGDLVVAWKVGLHWVLNWKSDRKRKAPGSSDQGCAGLASATLTAQQVLETISMLMASRWQESNQHLAHVSPSGLMPISRAGGPS